MATLADSSEEVFVTRMGDVYFFPCAFPHGSELKDLGSNTRVYPCIGQPYFAIGVDVGHLRQSTQENLVDQRVELTVNQVWRYLVSKGIVVGNTPTIVDGTPQRILAPNEVFVT